MGRRTKLSQGMIDKICNHVRNGLPNKDAIRLVGIDQSTFYKWKGAGEAPDAPPMLQKFFKSLKAAESEFKQANLEVIRRAATDPVVIEKIQ